jgi:hypothetical protein
MNCCTIIIMGWSAVLLKVFGNGSSFILVHNEQAGDDFSSFFPFPFFLSFLFSTSAFHVPTTISFLTINS